jgi:hypothetical protein
MQRESQAISGTTRRSGSKPITPDPPATASLGHTGSLGWERCRNRLFHQAAPIGDEKLLFIGDPPAATGTGFHIAKGRERRRSTPSPGFWWQFGESLREKQAHSISWLQRAHRRLRDRSSSHGIFGDRPHTEFGWLTTAYPRDYLPLNSSD